MSTHIAEIFCAGLDAVYADLLTIPPELADTPWRSGGWTRKQIVGHMLDSAANNRQRFVRASIDDQYTGPKYAQEPWVAAHGYSDQSWQTLLLWWRIEHDILAAVVKNVPEQRLQATCIVGDDEPVTLHFLIEDYVTHQRWHLEQLTALSN